MRIFSCRWLQVRARVHLLLSQLVQGSTVLLLSVGWATSANGAEPCTAAIGQWRWFIGGEVAFSPDGQVRWTPATASTPPASGTWSCDPEVGEYVVTWQNGFVDTLTLSPEGTKLTGTSSTGVAVSGWRAEPAVANTAVVVPDAPLTPPTSNAIDHNPSVSEILKNRPKLDPSGWKPGPRPPQKGPKPEDDD